MSYTHILAAIDTTEEAEEVLAKAAQIAKLHDAKLSLVSVVRPLTSYGSLAANTMAEMNIQVEAQALEHSKNELKRMAADLKVAEGDQYVLLGRPATEIRALADRLDVGLIVLGTHGRHGLGLMLGSTANGVVHGTTRDVLAVRVGLAEEAQKAA